MRLQTAGAWLDGENLKFARDISYKLVIKNALFYNIVNEAESNPLIFFEKSIGIKIALMN